MTQTKKLSKPINWNLITFCLSFITLICALFATCNQNEVNNLRTQLEKNEKEKKDLENQTAPNLYNKINEQRNYYENEIQDRNKIILNSEKRIDSIIIIGGEVVKKIDSNHILLSIRQAKNVLIQAEKGKYDSIRLSILFEKLSLLEERIEIQEKLIKVFDSSRILRDSLNANLQSEIDLLKLTINDYKEIVSIKDKPWYIILMGLTILIVFISGLLALKKKRYPTE